MKFKETSLGFEAEFDDFLFFFGKKEAHLQSLSTEYSTFQWARVRQTHSDLILAASGATGGDPREADAHHSATVGLALLISTADCIPALVADPKRRVSAAIHAGWRGVEQRIIPKTIKALIAEGSEARNLTVVLGPHIAFPSFEAGNDVRDLLLRSAGPAPSPEWTRALGPQKSLVDLRAIAHRQLEDSGVQNILDLEFDTKTDLRFHSHRRDREKSGRQLSFSCLLR